MRGSEGGGGMRGAADGTSGRITRLRTMNAAPTITIAPPIPTPESGAPPAMLMMTISASPSPTTMMPSESERLEARLTCGSASGICPRSIIAIRSRCKRSSASDRPRMARKITNTPANMPATRSEEHTSELQSQSNLVCRLLLEKKKKKKEKKQQQKRQKNTKE